MLNDLKWKQDEKCRKMCLLCEDTYRLAANWSQGAEREKYRLFGTESQDTLVFNFNWEAFSSRIGNLWVPVFCITCWSWTSHERHLAESTQFATCNIWLLKGPVVRRPRAVPKGGKGADSRRPPKNWRHVKTLFENIKNIKNIKHFRETPQFPSNSERPRGSAFFWLDSSIVSFLFFLKLRFTKISPIEIAAARRHHTWFDWMPAVVVWHLVFGHFLRKLMEKTMISEACSHFQMHKCGEISFSSRPKKLNWESSQSFDFEHAFKVFQCEGAPAASKQFDFARAQVNQVERWRQAVGFTEVSTYKTWIPYFIHVSSRGGLM